MKLGGESPASTDTMASPEPSNDASLDSLEDAPTEEPNSGNDDKPFDDTPFDAGVEADEDEDPKKFIQQLAGKLGQSLRQYTKEMGSPDFELEKFAVNSLLSATHTSKMESEDQKEIIKKVKTSGGADMSDDDGEESSDDAEVEDLDLDLEIGDEEEEPTEESRMFESEDPAYPKGWKEIDGKFMGPDAFKDLKSNLEEPALISAKKSSIFAPKGSPEYNEVNEHHDMTNTNYLKADRDEYLVEPEIDEPMVQPKIAPNPTPTPTEPLRRDKPFLPKRKAQPNPKAIDESSPWFWGWDDDKKEKEELNRKYREKMNLPDRQAINNKNNKLKMELISNLEVGSNLKVDWDGPVDVIIKSIEDGTFKISRVYDNSEIDVSTYELGKMIILPKNG